MLFIGDVHGKFHEYTYILHQNTNKVTIQLGDMGIGFKPFPSHIHENQSYFIRGNHDNPSLCKITPGYIPDGTYVEKLNTFFLGGAFSIDRYSRIEGVSFWNDEECTIKQLYEIIDSYSSIKPNIMASHDCPQSIAELWDIKENSRTRTALQVMLEIHNPKYWIFGHHHRKLNLTINNTNFICLPELETFNLEL